MHVSVVLANSKPDGSFEPEVLEKWRLEVAALVLSADHRVTYLQSSAPVVNTQTVGELSRSVTSGVLVTLTAIIEVRA